MMQLQPVMMGQSYKSRVSSRDAVRPVGTRQQCQPMPLRFGMYRSGVLTTIVLAMMVLLGGCRETSSEAGKASPEQAKPTLTEAEKAAEARREAELVQEWKDFYEQETGLSLFQGLTYRQARGLYQYLERLSDDKYNKIAAFLDGKTIKTKWVPKGYERVSSVIFYELEGGDGLRLTEHPGPEGFVSFSYATAKDNVHAYRGFEEAIARQAKQARLKK